MLSIQCTDGTFQLHSDDDSDADRSRMAVILAAHFDVEHAHVFCHLLWQRLGVGALLWLALGLLTPSIPAGMLVGVSALLCAVGIVGLLVEWRAERKLTRLLLGR